MASDIDGKAHQVATIGPGRDETSSDDSDAGPETKTRQKPAQDVYARSMLDLWNATAHPSLPRARELTQNRVRHASARLRERAIEGPDGWRAVLGRVNASTFCRGENDRGWLANFDWFLRPDTAIRVLEGRYDDRDRAAPKRDPAVGSALPSPRSAFPASGSRVMVIPRGAGRTA